MKLTPLMTLHVVSKPVEIGTGPQGTRTVFDVTSGTFQGSRRRGTVLPSGGDWLLVDAEGVGRLSWQSEPKTSTLVHLGIIPSPTTDY
jgi:hypothetical protein